MIILFDADGVVQRTPAGWLDRLVARLGETDREPEEMLDAIFAAEKPTVTGKADFRTAVAAVLTEWGRADRLDAVLGSWSEIEVDESVLAIVDRLRASGFRCCLATNQQSVRASYMHSLYDPHFDEEFYSCEIGVAKPDQAYFAAVLERLGTTTDQVVFIDDSPANIAAAGQIGIDARLYVDRNTFDWSSIPATKIVMSDVDLTHESNLLAGLINGLPVRLELATPAHVGNTDGAFGGLDVALRWSTPPNYRDALLHAELGGTVGGSPVTLAGEFQLSGFFYNYGSISGTVGNDEFRAESAPAGDRTTNAVQVVGHLGETSFSLSAGVAGDLTEGSIDGTVAGEPVTLWAERTEGGTHVHGRYQGPPILLGLIVGVLLYFL